MINNKAKLKKIADNIVLVTKQTDSGTLFSLHRILIKNNEKTASTVKFLSINTADLGYESDNHIFKAVKKEDNLFIVHSMTFTDNNCVKQLINYHNLKGDIVKVDII